MGVERTQKISDSSEKTIPVICSYCSKIYKVEKQDVAPDDQTAPAYGICKECFEKHGSFHEKKKDK